jgi:hypothetical protein
VTSGAEEPGKLVAALRDDRGYVWFLESLDALHRAMQGSSDLGEALDAALTVLLGIFGCDGAWLLQARGEAWVPVVERTRPEYPAGVQGLVEQSAGAKSAGVLREVLASDWCVQLDPEKV